MPTLQVKYRTFDGFERALADAARHRRADRLADIRGISVTGPARSDRRRFSQWYFIFLLSFVVSLCERNNK